MMFSLTSNVDVDVNGDEGEIRVKENKRYDKASLESFLQFHRKED